MPSKDMDVLKTRGVDIYDLLQIPSTATDSVIRKAYRQQALIYHPDKNPSASAADKFHLLTLTLNVLSDKQLRTEYDQWQNAKTLEKARTEQLGATRRKMKDELEQAEKDASISQAKRMWSKRKATESKDERAALIEKLRKEGALKRSKLEHEYLEKLKTKSGSSAEFHGDQSTTSDKDDRTVRVKWKFKEGISDLFTSDVLDGIMSVFGTVESAEILPRKVNSARYDTGVVTFKSSASAKKATQHDYAKKSDIWSQTSYKRLSGLLRETKWNKERSSTHPEVPGVLNKEDLTFDQYLDRTLQKLRAHGR